MIGIRPVHSESLRDACREVAMENNGFLYVDDRELRTRVKDEYEAKNEVQNSLLYTSKVSAERIRSELDGMAAGNEKIEHLDDTDGYFFDVLQFAGSDQEIIGTFESLFEYNTPIVREKKIESAIQDETNIAASDVSHLLERFTGSERDESSHLETLRAEGTTFYLPGKKLYENSNRPLADVEGELKEVAEAKDDYDGTVTRRDIERALEVEVPDKLIYNLIERQYLVELRGTERWLVNEGECIEEFTESAVEEEIVPRVEREFEVNDFVMPAATFADTIEETLDERTGIVDDLNEEVRETVLRKIEDSVVDALAADEDDEIAEIDLRERIDAPVDVEELELDEVPTYRLWESKVEAQVGTEAEQLDELRGEKDLRYFVENELDDGIGRFGDELVTQFYHERIEERLKELVKR